MDMAQVFIFDVGWIFFAAWGMASGALSVDRLRPRYLFLVAQRRNREKERSVSLRSSARGPVT